MKKTYIILMLFISALFTFSCETYDEFDAERPTIIGFTLGATTLQLTITPNNPSITFPVTFFVSETSNVERTFKVLVLDNPNGPAPENYSFDANIVIPANERRGVMPFTAMDVSLTNEYAPLELKFEESPGVLSGPTAKFELRNNN
jgi:hypothetical protein